jgi:tetratricopeptide (TPR) repeat protein
MKKLVFATAMALAGMSLVSARTLRAQDAGQNTGNISLPPEQYNAYQNATTQTDPTAKAAALESFLTTYPQSPVKKTVLTQLVDAYNQLNQPDKVLSAASRLLQVDPNNLQAILISVFLKKQACQKSVDANTGVASDTQSCDDSATLAQKGLTVTKPADTSDDDFKKLTANAYPVFHSAIAYDDVVSKKDYAGAIKEYTAELMLYPPAACTQPGGCLADTLNLAYAYAKPGDSRDPVKAIWFFARAWDYAPGGFKSGIEQQLDFWYKRYHGMLDGEAAVTQQINDIKTKAQATLFPPDGFTIAPAPSNQELANKYCAVSPDDLKKLALEDKEFILANGSKDCTDKLWGLMKDQPTPVPGIVIAAQATVLKISATTAASPKPKDFVVKLTTPGTCASVPVAPGELKIKDAQAYILANGVKADTDAMGDVLTETPVHLHKLSVEPAIGTINMAVTQDAKDAHTADFTVNLKEPVSCKEAPAVSAELKFQPDMELDGTYDSYTQVPAQGTTAASAQIVLRDGFVQQPVKKGAPVHHTAAKPAAGHHAQ